MLYQLYPLLNWCAEDLLWMIDGSDIGSGTYPKRLGNCIAMNALDEVFQQNIDFCVDWDPGEDGKLVKLKLIVQWSIQSYIIVKYVLFDEATEIKQQLDMISAKKYTNLTKSLNELVENFGTHLIIPSARMYR